MYQISDKEFALEKGDIITFVKDGGGTVFGIKEDKAGISSSFSAEKVTLSISRDYDDKVTLSLIGLFLALSV